MGIGQLVLIFIGAFILYSTAKNFGLVLMFFAMRRYSKDEDKTGALAQIEKALNFPMPPSPKLTCAYILLKEGRPDKAEEVIAPLRTVETKRFNSNEARLHYSLIYWKKGELDKAIESLEELMAEGYRNSILYGNLGVYLIEKGDLDRALEVTQEGLEYNSSSLLIRDNLGLIYIKKKEWDEAARVYDELLTEIPGFPDPYYNRALIHKQSGQWEEARDLLIKAEGKSYNYLSTLALEQVQSLLEEADRAILESSNG
ncbi:MAG: tetratricopeptide repeat protein [Spirochaetales bacterium]|nr:tetratricopeptide repeat protein [Spirochaetales bacterium]